MAISFYDLSVGSYLQTLGGVIGFLDRGLGHCRDNNIDPQEIIETRLCGDMLPFSFQITSIVHHSLGAIEGMKQGVFQPPTDRMLDYAGFQALVVETRDTLAKLTPEEIDYLEGRDMIFKIRDFTLPFTTTGFLMSFSLPNFYFHATTAYDILRSKGVPLGKRDYMGQLRIKT
jgi:hypothetical protein